MISDDRLDEMIKGMKIYADMPYGINFNEFSAKEIYNALQELKVRREENKFDEDLLKIVSHYKELQVIKLVEEMAELTQAIMKTLLIDEDEYKDESENILKNLQEEIADVEIILRQLYLTKTPEVRSKVSMIKEYKIKRTLENISKDDKKEE